MKKKIEKKEENLRVDVNNDAEMVALGIRPRNLEPRDPSVWVKSYQDKKNAKLVKHYLKHAFDYVNWPAPKRPIPVPGTLIITIRKNKDFSDKQSNGKLFYKTTFSHRCIQSDIPELLSKYVSKTKNGNETSLVIKYKWNGKEYKYGELPFWYGK